MSNTLTIRATTTTEDIEEAIRYSDMRREARERRDDAAAVLAEQGDQAVFEMHHIDGVDVLFSLVYGYALVNEWSTGVGDSLLIGNGECDSPGYAVSVWRGAEA